ncbi:penicillin-binding transpeptidase domain-containing protein [Ktedonospora formicarum]|uniref:Cell division protein FtsI n=1 Tax=Ktedonospora formicarum TaxID=2778364 RepID=A0A8J3MSU3_9CHLR|nr:penicillin-binding transpeptidase domain-containing protein [Ktedonospora formicarum]GHO46480.1 cell division protein FtsI [Ktedonospora formicarum]
MYIEKHIRRLMQLFMVIFIATSAGLVYWQVIVANQVTANDRNQRRCLSYNMPERGRIFDRNGVLLADSRPDPNACGGYVRHYYEPSLAGLIGYYPGPNFPSLGLEAAYDDYLSGLIGLTSLDNQVNKTLHRAPVGDDLYLSIDVRIQRLVAQHFKDPIHIDSYNTFSTNRGSIIVMDPQTGQTLAMLSSPGYDPNKMVQTLSKNDQSYFERMTGDANQPLLFRPTQGLYAPGSTYKTMTLLAGIDSGTTSLERVYDPLYTHGPVVLGQHTLERHLSNLDPFTKDYHVSTNYGFAHSDNILFAKIGVDMGVDKWLEYNKRFYVGQSIPFDLPIAKSSVTRPDGTLEENMLVDNVFGQGVDFTTPMQIEMINNIAANNGQLMQPSLVSKIASRDGSPVQTFEPRKLGEQQVSQQAARDTRKAMFGVDQCGSGSLDGVDLNKSPWNIIAKTGSAELGGGKPAHSWLMTQAPYDWQHPEKLPALSILAMKENGGEGGYAVGPIVASIYNDIFNKGYVKADRPISASSSYCCTAKLLQIGC